MTRAAAGILLTRALAVVACLLPVGAAGLDLKKPLAEFMHQTWTVDDGLPQSTIRGITQTADGYLWFATHEGVARFDGLTFTVYNEANAPALKGSGVTALLARNDGSLLLGLRDGGVARHHKGRFEALQAAGGLPAGAISMLAEDASGALWVGSSANGFARVVGGQSTLFATGPGSGLPSNWITSVRAIPGGEVWIGTSQGLVAFRDGKITPAPTGTFLDAASIAAIATGRDGSVWVATSGEGLAVREGGAWKRYRRANGLASDTLTRLVQDRDGAMWIGTLEGVQRFSGGTFEGFGSPDGLTNNFIRELFEDVEGNIWVGTDRGIDRFRDSLISTWGVRKGLAEEFARVVLEDRKGRVWVGTSDGLFAITPTAVRRYGREHGLLNGAILALAEDGDGALWVGTNGGGLHRQRGDRFDNVSARLPLSSASVRAILPARDGRLWVATNSGLIVGTWKGGDGGGTRLTVAEGLPSEQINALLEDAEGRIWVGARGGLGMIEANAPGRVRPVGRELNATATVLALNGGGPNQIWISTVTGLALLTPGSGASGFALRSFTGAEGIPAQTYFSVIDDGRGKLWMCSNRGIYKVARAALEELAAGKVKSVVPAQYGRAEGMTTAQCNGASQPAGWKTRDGRILFPTARGVAVADPARQPAGLLRPPPVHIKQVLIDAEPAEPGADGTLVITPGKHRIEIAYVGLNLTDPEKVRYRYQLEGFDRDWVEAGNEAKAVFTNVTPGTYVFKVLAGTANGAWNTEGASLVIDQRPHVYQTTWFRLLGALAILAAGFAVYRGRIAQLNAQGRRLQAMVDERTRDLASEKEKLESASNERARLLMQVADAAKAYEKLSKEDSLTGLSNRRELDRFMAHEFERAQRNGRPLSVALADLDFFKKINDLHSHAVGDEVLKVVADILRTGVRGIDMVGRYGGEEFVLVLPEADKAVARQICERLRAAIEAFDWPSKQAGPRVTMSFGVATYSDETSYERLLALADERLYEAKEGGRNRVCD